ncbi:MAG TPA: YfiR family protein, partial [Steroidobacteraceae bacterium]|nr:YfiR family protein [Steroidobacteraceae bacterium]
MAACYRRIWLSLALCALPYAFATETVAPEYNVKAAYLPLFARYVAWPERTFSDAKSPVVIAVVGRDPFGDILDETVRG